MESGDESVLIKNVIKMPIEKKEQEQERLNIMLSYEKSAKNKGHSMIAGLDEAGRGPWAGPVSAAVVILPDDFYLEGVNDSKKLTEKKRKYLAEKIKKMALDWSVVFVNPVLIDEMNILEATRFAMTEAVKSLRIKPDYLLLDAITLPELIEIPQKPIIKGDQKSLSIACASILAKVMRDEAMKNYNTIYPGYCFDKHKGYGTKLHKENLDKLGICPIHRLSYKPVQKVYKS